MTIEDFINSGVLEFYVLNLCSAEEKIQIERLMLKNSLVRLEIQAIEHALERFALSYTLSLPYSLEYQIIKQIKMK